MRTNNRTAKESSKARRNSTTKDDAAVRAWFANTLLSLAETLVSTAASAPPAVRRRIGKERHIRHELTESLLPVVTSPGMHDVCANLEATKLVQKNPQAFGGMTIDA